MQDYRYPNGYPSCNALHLFTAKFTFSFPLYHICWILIEFELCMYCRRANVIQNDVFHFQYHPYNKWILRFVSYNLPPLRNYGYPPSLSDHWLTVCDTVTFSFQIKWPHHMYQATGLHLFGTHSFCMIKQLRALWISHQKCVVDYSLSESL